MSFGLDSLRRACPVITESRKNKICKKCRIYKLNHSKVTMIFILFLTSKIFSVSIVILPYVSAIMLDAQNA